MKFASAPAQCRSLRWEKIKVMASTGYDVTGVVWRSASVWIMALAGGMVVANNYYNQPLISTFARTFGVDHSMEALVATATQSGYALGLLFLLPLGDRLGKRCLMTVMPSVLLLRAASVRGLSRLSSDCPVRLPRGLHEHRLPTAAASRAATRAAGVGGARGRTDPGRRAARYRDFAFPRGSARERLARTSAGASSMSARRSPCSY